MVIKSEDDFLLEILCTMRLHSIVGHGNVIPFLFQVFPLIKTLNMLSVGQRLSLNHSSAIGKRRLRRQSTTNERKDLINQNFARATVGKVHVYGALFMGYRMSRQTTIKTMLLLTIMLFIEGLS